MTPPLEIRIEELVLVGVPLVHEERLAPAVEAALAARLAGDPGAAPPAADGVYEIEASSLDALAEGVAASLHDAIRAELE